MIMHWIIIWIDLRPAIVLCILPETGADGVGFPSPAQGVIDNGAGSPGAVVVVLDVTTACNVAAIVTIAGIPITWPPVNLSCLKTMTVGFFKVEDVVVVRNYDRVAIRINRLAINLGY